MSRSLPLAHFVGPISSNAVCGQLPDSRKSPRCASKHYAVNEDLSAIFQRPSRSVVDKTRAGPHATLGFIDTTT
jgi:hypothetical protein